MARSSDVLENVNVQLSDLTNNMSNFSKHLSTMVENYDMLTENQVKVADNHDIVVENQRTIIKNQGIITHNQISIINNQSVIVNNQAYLKTLIYGQIQILTLLTNKDKSEISEEIHAYLKTAQLEISKGFEYSIGGDS